MILLNYKLMM